MWDFIVNWKKLKHLAIWPRKANMYAQNKTFDVSEDLFTSKFQNTVFCKSNQNFQLDHLNYVHQKPLPVFSLSLADKRTLELWPAGIQSNKQSEGTYCRPYLPLRESRWRWRLKPWSPRQSQFFVLMLVWNVS